MTTSASPIVATGRPRTAVRQQALDPVRTGDIAAAESAQPSAFRSSQQSSTARSSFSVASLRTSMESPAIALQSFSPNNARRGVTRSNSLLTAHTPAVQPVPSPDPASSPRSGGHEERSWGAAGASAQRIDLPPRSARTRRPPLCPPTACPPRAFADIAPVPSGSLDCVGLTKIDTTTGRRPAAPAGAVLNRNFAACSMKARVSRVRPPIVGTKTRRERLQLSGTLGKPRGQSVLSIRHVRSRRTQPSKPSSVGPVPSVQRTRGPAWPAFCCAILRDPQGGYPARETTAACGSSVERSPGEPGRVGSPLRSQRAGDLFRRLTRRRRNPGTVHPARTARGTWLGRRQRTPARVRLVNAGTQVMPVPRRARPARARCRLVSPRQPHAFGPRRLPAHRARLRALWLTPEETFAADLSLAPHGALRAMPG